MRRNHIVLLALFLQAAYCCKSFVINPKSWTYKGHFIGYDEAHTHTTASDVIPGTLSLQHSKVNDEDPILLLNGFGVGSFHQHRLMAKLLEHEPGRLIYCMDYLGQGRSWPVDCDDGNSGSEAGLIYSADTWIDQLIKFIEEVIRPGHGVDNALCKVHVVGNSVGGHLAVFLAARRPDLVGTLCLLNPTPFWGINLPGWDAHLPPPIIPKVIGRFFFDRIRDLKIIDTMLSFVYANRGAFDEDFCKQIRGCTEGKGGHAAFASILWAPPAATKEKGCTFYDSLTQLDCDVLVVFGRDDPWCKPAFARKMLNYLDQRPSGKVHRYIELENVGHCPNHEAPQLVGKLTSLWISAVTHTPESLVLVEGKEERRVEPWGEIIARERQGSDVQLSFADRITNMLI